ncbi:DgyrCDS2885 [Dimorphilus gyrociliatus]|uniref:DgyrCDS2885 n=1 Tax=Dimorphilus gyrociliatus TaxID=2664684 RepID=A0A7I8VEA4_9ANNE|nr:DgyrCDS2885 [Dimorphilus gyrociliatus]
MESLFKCLLVITLCSIGNLEKPNVKIRVTENGLRFINDFAPDIIMEALREIKFPNIGESSYGLEAEIYNIRLVEIPKRLDVDIYTVEGVGLQIYVRNVFIKIRSDYSYKFWSISSSKGTMDVDTVNFGVKVLISNDNSSGKPSLQITECTSSGDVAISFGHDIGSVLNIITTIFRKDLVNLVKNSICTTGREKINDVLKRYLPNAKFPVNIDSKKYSFSLSLTEPVTFKKDYFDIKERVELLEFNSQSKYPVAPPQIPDMDNNVSKMVYLVLSSHVINSASYSLFRAGGLSIRISKNSPFIPPEMKKYFRSTCQENEICLGNYLQTIKTKYPNHSLSLFVRALRQPTVSINNNEINLKLQVAIDLEVQKDKMYFSILESKVNSSIDCVLNLAGDGVDLDVTDIRAKFVVDKTEISFFKYGSFLINGLAKTFFQTVLIPEINAQGPFQIPIIQDILKIGNLKLVNTGHKDILAVGGDLTLGIELKEL